MTDETHEASRFRIVVGRVIERVETGQSLKLDTVDYFNHVTVADLPNSRETIKKAISLVKTARRTGKLEDLKTLLR
jgi:hypothetical protein